MLAHLSKAIKSVNAINDDKWARESRTTDGERHEMSRDEIIFIPNLIADIYPSFLCVNFFFLFGTSANFCEEVPRSNNKKVTLDSHLTYRVPFARSWVLDLHKSHDFILFSFFSKLHHSLLSFSLWGYFCCSVSGEDKENSENTLSKKGRTQLDEGKPKTHGYTLQRKNVWKAQRTKKITAVDMRSTQFSPSSTSKRFRPKSWTVERKTKTKKKII